LKLNEAYDEYILEKGIQESGKDLKGYTNRVLKTVQKDGKPTKRKVRKAFKTTPFSFSRYQLALETTGILAPIIHYVTQPKNVRKSKELSSLRQQIGTLTQEGSLNIKNPQETVDKAYAIIEDLHRHREKDKFPTFSRMLDTVQKQRQEILETSAKRLAKQIPRFGKAMTETVIKAYQDSIDSGSSQIDAIVGMVGETQYKSNIALRNFLHKEFHADYERTKIETASDLGFDYKYWRTQRDGRVRHSHMIMDGKIVKSDESFKIGRHKAMYPGDPTLPIEEAVNCRCFTESAFVPRGTRKGYELPLDPPPRGAAGSVLPIASLVDEVEKLTPYNKVPVTKQGIYAHYSTPREDVKIPYSKENAIKLGTYNMAHSVYKDHEFTRTMFEAGMRFNKDNLELLDRAASAVSNVTSLASDQSKGSGSYFSSYTNSLHVGSFSPVLADQIQLSTKTILHEYGHAADWNAGYRLKGTRPTADKRFDLSDVWRSKKYTFTLDRGKLPKNWSYKKRTSITIVEATGSDEADVTKYDRKDKQFGYSLANMVREESYEIADTIARKLYDEGGYEARYQSDPAKFLNANGDRFSTLYADLFPEMMSETGRGYNHAVLNELHPFFDLFSGSFGSKMYSPFGHAQSYWAGRKTPDNDVLNKEVVANFFEAETSNAYGIKALKKTFPKTYEMFQEYKEEMKKRL